MSYVNNDVYLELEKLDYNNCQAVHYNQRTLCYMFHSMKATTNEPSNICNDNYVTGAAASIFEPERSLERLA
ncbi:hypothetical protein TSUD_94710 [Trifolium subterraneum]|uniref:Uncharacterized protein n=1 Tax=Trifolium subterraneum TaxID=3900 RepID=A0A2Z6PD17_TRISU|nr:hypothetical protein TSUD_94710 [Trifolium subterraneum]